MSHNKNMSLIYKRAIKITELSEELEEAKSIISDFVWGSDCTPKQYEEFKIRAARFAGCTIPVMAHGSGSEVKESE